MTRAVAIAMALVVMACEAAPPTRHRGVVVEKVYVPSRSGVGLGYAAGARGGGYGPVFYSSSTERIVLVASALGTTEHRVDADVYGALEVGDTVTLLKRAAFRPRLEYVP